jgi:glycine dehydrogenase subunit 1
MSYTSLSQKDKKAMLAKIGISSIDELFDSIPKNVLLKQELNVPGCMTEPELIRHFDALARKNTYHNSLSFLGAGAYPHVIPSIVDYLSSRGEFISPYTPYQPEVSQGTLQIIYEFQTLICQLTGMDCANASLYDGASGAAEAVLMAHRIQSKPKILVARTVHPQYREVIETYTKNLDVSVQDISYSKNGEIDLKDLEQKIGDETSAVLVQSPNFFGVIEKLKEISDLAHRNQTLSIAVIAEPTSLGILESPGQSGMDIVTGEGQSFGLPLSFGGPYLGFMACQKEFIRQVPGRLVGVTQDVEGKRGFVLTLSTREQHIRRERATSNICTNQAWCALRATIYLEAMGKKGMRELAWQNLQKAHYALDRLTQLEGVSLKFDGPIFNEFVLQFEKPWEEIDEFMKGKGIIGGFSLQSAFSELSDCALVCITEVHAKEDINQLVSVLKEAIQ